MMLIFGFDPGGKSGVAIGRVQNSRLSIQCRSAESVDAAIDWLIGQSGEIEPNIVGIDSFLSWSTAKSGWRNCDLALREAYPKMRSSVLCSNSTYGSMAVQGMAFACKLREKWPNVLLNEVHPKVLLSVVAKRRRYPRKWPSGDSEKACKWLSDSGCLLDREASLNNEHEFDAVLAVWASYQGLARHWPVDLAALDAGVAVYPAGSVRYFWPEQPRRST